MSAYTDREERYDEAKKKGYHQIMSIAKSSSYPSVGNGKQFVDFIVGTENSKIAKVRVLVDFRGEYFYSFPIECSLPEVQRSKIRNTIHFSAKDAYDSIIRKVAELNRTN